MSSTNLSSIDAGAARHDPEALHPALWRAHRLGRAGAAAVWRSGFAALDAELPGGGWPCQALTELLLPRPGIGEVRLLAPVLAAARQAEFGAAPRRDADFETMSGIPVEPVYGPDDGEFPGVSLQSQQPRSLRDARLARRSPSHQIPS